MPNKTSKTKGPSQRQLRAGELIRRVLGDVLAEASIRDPDLQGVSITITEVRPSPDLKYASVYCVPLGGKDMDKMIAGLKRSAAFLRLQLGKEMETRFVPRLNFLPDTTFDTASEMNALLSRPEIKRDLVSGSPENRDGEDG